MAHQVASVANKPITNSAEPAKGSSYGKYHQLFTERQNELWQRAKRPEQYHATITTTWELAFDEIKKTPGALELLNLCCILDPEGIPLGLIKQIASVGSRHALTLQTTVADELALDDALGALRRYSLVQRAEGDLNLHRLVQAVARSRMEETLHQNWLEVTLELVLKSWPFQQSKMETWEESKALLPQLISVADLAHAQNFAEHLNLSIKTVSTYRSRLLIKLGMRTTAELIRYALDQQLV